MRIERIRHAFDLLEDSAAVTLAGARLGPYRIEHKLGEGGTRTAVAFS